MRIYCDQDADLALLQARQIAVIGYGNQGRAQALNLRDSGLQVIVGNREDAYADQACADGFTPLPIDQAAADGDVVMLLIPDEVMPEVFEAEIAPRLSEGDALSFASGYNVAFGQLALPPTVDAVLVAPRMIGVGVRDLYVAGRHSGGAGFPSFIGVAQDRSGQARAIALALAKGIGSTRMGVVEVTFAQEAELDLFTEQCFGPAFGHVLTSAVDLLLEEGYPPEAVLLELYMSGELSYTLAKIAEVGMIEQTALHSRTSQYGSMSRGMRFMLPELRARMREGLDDIRSGRFAEEWIAEKEAGCPTLETLREAARALPLYRLERELRAALGGGPLPVRPVTEREGVLSFERSEQRTAGPAERSVTWLRGLWPRRRRRRQHKPADREAPEPLSADLVEPVLRAFLAHAAEDPALQAFASNNQLTTHYVLREPESAFYLRFEEGRVTGGLGPSPIPAEVRIEADAEILDGMLSGRINAMRAAMTGKLTFGGNARQAMSLQRIQGDLCRLYRQARQEIVTHRSLQRR
jgi:ketol-acid reductoisomerase